MQIPQRAPNENKEQVLPLINVAFLLLIFFMLVGTLAVPDDIDPVQSASDQPVVDKGVVILVDVDAGLTVDGEPTAHDQLTGVVQGLRRPGEVLDVRVKPDANLRAVELVRVLALLRNAGVESIRLVTLPLEQ